MIFKCKMCGGALDVAVGASIAECPYCGAKQTLPKLDDEKRANLYDRAGHFRRMSDFDKAMALYEEILREDGTDAEAYWSIVLCRYGIEYVEDPATHRRIPTVNRAQLTSILADEDYKAALTYADGHQRELYEAEAKEIENIQKGILAISEREAPFDVFICYKETDERGVRTRDSVLANDLYYELTNEGYKVFFSRITLEDKLGTAYEPYIFAALRSAPVMVVVGTKPEYLNAPWVKNEWSRYLALIRGGAKKTLIPAYRDMDPYDLPDAFSHLQAQDMSKLGFMQDLLRGIKKLVPREQTKTNAPVEGIPPTAPGAVAPLLRRATMALEDEEWDRADGFCEQALNIEPECAEAYLIKLLAQLHLHREEELRGTDGAFVDAPNCRKAMRFDAAVAERINGYLRDITAAREQERQAELARKREEELRRTETEYQYTVEMQNHARYPQDFLAAAMRFEHIGSYMDAPVRAQVCRARQQELITAEFDRNYHQAQHTMTTAKKPIDYLQAAELFRHLNNWRDASQKAEECTAEYNRLTKKTYIRAAILAGAIILLVVLTILIVVNAYDCYRSKPENQLTWEKNDDDGITITGYQFEYAFNPDELTIPATIRKKPVTRIGDGAFSSCTRLTEVTIPESVRSIGNSAFSNCTRLKSITIPSGVTSIGNNAFSDCTMLESITIPGSITTIGTHAFHNCAKLQSIHLNEGVTNIGNSAFFGCKNLQSIYLPASLASIGSNVFYGCNSVTTATLPAIAIGSITKSNLETVIVNSGDSIPDSAFYKCDKLTSVTLAWSISSIGTKAFQGCRSLFSITIPSSVKLIGPNAFADCTKLTGVVFATSSGWYTTWYLDATNGTNLPYLSNAANNANYLTDTYVQCYWKRK